MNFPWTAKKTSNLGIERRVYLGLILEKKERASNGEINY